MELDKYIDRKIKIILKNNFTYVGKVLSSGEDFVKIKDKYQKIVFISINEIKVVEEVNDGVF